MHRTVALRWSAALMTDSRRGVVNASGRADQRAFQHEPIEDPAADIFRNAKEPSRFAARDPEAWHVAELCSESLEERDAGRMVPSFCLANAALNGCRVSV